MVADETLITVLDDYLSILQKHDEGQFFDLLHAFKNNSFYAGDFGVQVLQTNFVVSFQIASLMTEVNDELKNILQSILDNAKTDSEELALMRNLILSNVSYNVIEQSLVNKSDIVKIKEGVDKFLSDYSLARN